MCTDYRRTSVLRLFIIPYRTVNGLLTDKREGKDGFPNRTIVCVNLSALIIGAIPLIMYFVAFLSYRVPKDPQSFSPDRHSIVSEWETRERSYYTHVSNRPLLFVVNTTKLSCKWKKNLKTGLSWNTRARTLWIGIHITSAIFFSKTHCVLRGVRMLYSFLRNLNFLYYHVIGTLWNQQLSVVRN